MRYDFSKEFPELFSSEDFSEALYKDKLNTLELFAGEVERANYWRYKYNRLLDEYNKMLLVVETDSKLQKGITE